ncbi:hypothetical protein CYMTET_36315 [Cymbomonas tetramitiformis]|uniref:Uncharacterized protein n=1 Tax=Cymbomonas tetramitiformis TaxID=36881 RepID=A0AAE0F7I3_9CHLO|nr:hypothetical protein CYMTET_36315 [Cymbomonas tetramitiformis]
MLRAFQLLQFRVGAVWIAAPALAAADFASSVERRAEASPTCCRRDGCPICRSRLGSPLLHLLKPRDCRSRVGDCSSGLDCKWIRSVVIPRRRNAVTGAGRVASLGRHSDTHRNVPSTTLSRRAFAAAHTHVAPSTGAVPCLGGGGFPPRANPICSYRQPPAAALLQAPLNDRNELLHCLLTNPNKSTKWANSSREEVAAVHVWPDDNDTGGALMMLDAQSLRRMLLQEALPPGIIQRYIHDFNSCYTMLHAAWHPNFFYLLETKGPIVIDKKIGDEVPVGTSFAVSLQHSGASSGLPHPHLLSPLEGRGRLEHLSHEKRATSIPPPRYSELAHPPLIIP